METKLKQEINVQGPSALLTLAAASCWVPRRTGSRCGGPAPMNSAVQGQGSACGPVDPEQIQANWGEERYFISTAAAAAQK